VDRDTSGDAARAQVDAVRRLGRVGRLAAAVGMSEDARTISIDGIKRRHPEYSEAQVQHVMLCALYGNDLAEKFARSRSTK
jgi:hypothetical protein